jgi:hypothetical protein
MRKVLAVLVAGSWLSAAFAAGPIQFENVTAKAGLEPLLKDWRLAHSASWGDVNDDGFPDLYLGAFASVPRWTDGPIPNMLWFSQGGKTFTLSPQKELQFDRQHARPSQVLMADLDQDGDLDMMIACHASRTTEVQTTLWENVGQGRFRDVTPKSGYWPCPMGYRNVAAVDFNGDGLLDLVACDNNYSNWSTGKGSLLILINKGGFRFEDGREALGFPPDGTTGFGLAVGDVNDDGMPDFFVADCNRFFVSQTGGQLRYREVLPGTFVKPQGRDKESRTCGAVFGDVNGDGLLDLATSEHGGESQTRLYLCEGIRNGMPSYRQVTKESGLEGPLPAKGITGMAVKCGNLALVDLDNDGWKDLWIGVVWRDAASNLQPIVYRNLGPGTDGMPRFGSVPLDRIVGYYATAPVVDFDRDGRMDMFMAAWFKWDETPSILYRNTTDAGHWLEVRVKGGGKLNTMGLGAVCRAYRVGGGGNGKTLIQRQDIVVGDGYASGGEALAHLGLGTNTTVDLEIKWAGTTRLLTNQAADRLVTVDWTKP